MTEILTERVSAPNVWRGDELADTGRWIIRFTEEAFADFERALAHVSKKHLKDVTEIRAEDSRFLISRSGSMTSWTGWNTV